MHLIHTLVVIPLEMVHQSLVAKSNLIIDVCLAIAAR